MALALRFDVSRGKESQYFKSAFIGYAAGVVLTIVVMNWFQAAQVRLSSMYTYFSSHSCVFSKEELVRLGIILKFLIISFSFSACTSLYRTRGHWIFGGTCDVER